MKRNHFSIVLIVFFSCFLFACGKAPNTVKVLRGLNNAVANYWIDLVQKNGVNYVDYDGESIIAIALEAENIELLQATIKDGADLHREYKNSHGNERFPLTFLIPLTDRVYNKDTRWDMVEMLLNAGTILRNETADFLLGAWQVGNLEFVEALLPAYKKQNLLDYSTFNETMVRNAVFEAYNADDKYFRDEDEAKKEADIEIMSAVFSVIADNGIKLPRSEKYIPGNGISSRHRSMILDIMRMGGMEGSEFEYVKSFLSNPNIKYARTLSRIYREPFGESEVVVDGFIKELKRHEGFELIDEPWVTRMVNPGYSQSYEDRQIKIRTLEGVEGWVSANVVLESEYNFRERITMGSTDF